jgi:hypothetical protein
MQGYKWPYGTLLHYWIDMATDCPAELDPQKADFYAETGLTAWALHCGIRYARVQDRSQAQILCYWDPTVEYSDGDNDLALTELPLNPGPTTQLTNRLNPAPRGGWTLNRLFLTEIHEGGHAIGQVHAPADVLSIMSPVLNESLHGPTSFDAANAVADYGPGQKEIHALLVNGGQLVYTDPAPGQTLAVPPGVQYAPTEITLPDGSTLTLSFRPPPA